MDPDEAWALTVQGIQNLSGKHLVDPIILDEFAGIMRNTFPVPMKDWPERPV